MSDEGSRDSNIAKGCLSTAAFLIFIAILVGSAFTNSGSRDSTDRSSVRWNDYDVVIDVRKDGTIHVVEDQEVAFRGTFRTGYAEIPMEHLESISNVSVAVEPGPRDLDNNGVIDRDEARVSRQPVTSVQIPSNSLVGPNEFRAFEDGDVYRIDYGFDPTSQSRPTYSRSAPETRRIVLAYDVSGVIRDYPDAAEPWQQLHWMAISDLVTEIADIDTASVTINLPEDVPAEDMAWAPEPDEVSGNQLIWHRGKMSEGDDFDVQVAFPAITSATAPAWQVAADAHDAEIEASANRRSLASLMLIGAGVLVVVGGGLALLYAWYTGINERVPGLVPDILPEPPGDLPAALVGALVDEQVNPRDIAAAIMDLNARGIVKIEKAGAESGSQARYDITLVQPIETAHSYEQVVLNAIFPREKTPPVLASFDSLRVLFGAYRQDIQDAMNQALVDRGYFTELPSASRRKWGLALKVLVGLSGLVAAAILLVLRSWTWWAILPPVCGVLVYFAGTRMTPSIARKTAKGAEASARWKAFERYLQQTGGGIFGQEWKAISAKYMPWIVAFGIDHQWLGRMNTPSTVSGRWSSASTSPAWMTGTPRGTSSGRSLHTSPGSFSGAGWSPSWGGWDASRWSDMQSTSNNLLGSIGDASDSLFSMMGDAMEAIGKSSGSGGGSGGSSFGGGSSHSSGGHSHSSSGGGSRGFH